MTAITATLIGAFTFAASSLSGLPYDGKEVPTVRQTGRCNLIREFYSKPYLSDAKCKAMVKALAPIAYYDPGSKRITLSKEFNLASPRDRNILIHELTHYLQHKAGRTGMECVNGVSRMELQAYKAGADYLKTIGDDPAKYGLTPALMINYSRHAC